MIALISDIHANLEALCAVLDDCSHQGVDSIICLGDIVGYGPDPEKCTDLVMQEADQSILGNHDFALLNIPFRFNPLAAEVIRKTQEIMRPGAEDYGKTLKKGTPSEFFKCRVEGGVTPCTILNHSRPERWEFYKNMPEKTESGDVLYVHGSPLDPTFEYVFPASFESSWDPGRISELFQSILRFCFCGHTHIPCAIASDLECIYPPECGYHLRLNPGKKYIINTGSVGQPRDRDSRACYLLFDEENKEVTWRRIAYDIDSVVRKSDAMCGAGNWCGARLRHGK